MSLAQRIERLERAVGSEAHEVDGEAIRAEILALLNPENVAIVESLRAAAMVEDCDLTLKSGADTTLRADA